MSNPFEFNGSFDDLIRQFASGAKAFARQMADEVKAHEAEFSQFRRGPQGGCCGDASFDLRFSPFSHPRYESRVKPDGALEFRFMLPGFEESAINLSFKGDSMILKAKAPEAQAEEAGRARPFVRDIERREYPVPADRYDQAAAAASLRNGILTVTIPAKPEDPAEVLRVNIVKEGN